ncbi:MAG: DUF433 domain-containing protein [Candidatus Tectomicrobia bacterium]|nr:DUF433 domain-containing protein [Candidatus Tectomicrobia bacterium]
MTISRFEPSTIYGGQDPREMPAYSVAEAAHYLQIPPSTLRSWCVGRDYPTKAGKKRFQPILSLPDRPEGDPPLFSFLNLVEAHVLDAVRRHHRIVLWKVREAITYLERQFPSRHPLADQQFVTNGVDLFIEKYGQLINISQEGQLAMREVFQTHLRRIDRDPAGVPLKLYLFTRTHRPDEPKVVVIDPYVSFGRPVLAGTGIPTAIIAERYKAGESIHELASDYDQQPWKIEEAIRCELHGHAA